MIKGILGKVFRKNKSEEKCDATSETDISLELGRNVKLRFKHLQLGKGRDLEDLKLEKKFEKIATLEAANEHNERDPISRLKKVEIDNLIRKGGYIVDETFLHWVTHSKMALEDKLSVVDKGALVHLINSKANAVMILAWETCIKKIIQIGQNLLLPVKIRNPILNKYEHDKSTDARLQVFHMCSQYLTMMGYFNLGEGMLIIPVKKEVDKFKVAVILVDMLILQHHMIRRGLFSSTVDMPKFAYSPPNTSVDDSSDSCEDTDEPIYAAQSTPTRDTDILKKIMPRTQEKCIPIPPNRGIIKGKRGTPVNNGQNIDGNLQRTSEPPGNGPRQVELPRDSDTADYSEPEYLTMDKTRSNVREEKTETWACEFCTYANNVANKICEMCSKTRTYPSPQEECETHAAPPLELHAGQLSPDTMEEDIGEFTEEDFQVALQFCGNEQPLEWLRRSYRCILEMVVANVAAHMDEEDADETISIAEAREALCKHKGSLLAAVKECVFTYREQKYLGVSDEDKRKLTEELLQRGFPESDVAEAVKCCSDLTFALSYLQQLCVICKEKFPAHKMVTMLNCEHQCCTDCCSSHFTLQIKEKSILSAVCPSCSEPSQLDDEEIFLNYFSQLEIMLRGVITEGVHDLLLTKIRDSALQNQPNFNWCPKCESGYIVETTFAARLVCPGCDYSTCNQCWEPWEEEHAGISCKQFAALKLHGEQHGKSDCDN